MYHCFPIQFIWWKWIHSPFLIDWSLLSLTLFPFPNNIKKMYTELLTPHFLFSLYYTCQTPTSKISPKYFLKSTSLTLCKQFRTQQCIEHAQFHTLLCTYTFCFEQYAIAIIKTMQWTRSSIRTKDFSLAHMHRHTKLESENFKVFFYTLGAHLRTK